MARADGLIRAAGAVVIDTQERVLVVHRPAYDDITLPKGKLKGDERSEVAAVREVLEETGTTIVLETALPSIRYRVGRRDKQVDWWRAHPVTVADRLPDKEVDSVHWLPVAMARKRLTHPEDRATLDSALASGSGPALLVLRHTKAVPRKKWRKKPDPLRPLNRRGKAQAKALTPLLAAYGVGQVISSPSKRCMATVAPYADHLGVEIKSFDALSEEAFEADPTAVGPLMEKLLAEARATRRPAVICGHRPVLPEMLAAIGLPTAKLAKGGFIVLHPN